MLQTSQSAVGRSISLFSALLRFFLCKAIIYALGQLKEIHTTLRLARFVIFSLDNDKEAIITFVPLNFLLIFGQYPRFWIHWATGCRMRRTHTLI